ncbi:MAG TPA: hypothetical protein VGE01_05565, partial [Fimbriimonas sp.]
ALAMGVVGIASAQTNGPSGFSGRIGAHWPNVGDANLALGLDYKFQSVPVEQARRAYWSYLGASIDYYGRNGDNYNIPLALTYNVRNNQFVFSAGLGWDFLREGGDDDSGLGAQLAASYDFGETDVPGETPFFVQAKYFFAHDTDLSGFGLYLGARF